MAPAPKHTFHWFPLGVAKVEWWNEKRTARAGHSHLATTIPFFKNGICLCGDERALQWANAPSGRAWHRRMGLHNQYGGAQQRCYEDHVRCAAGHQAFQSSGRRLNAVRHSGSITSSNARLVRNNCGQRLDRSREPLGGPLPPDPSESTPLYCCPNNAYFSTAKMEIVMNGEPKPGEGGKILEIHRAADSNKQTQEHVDSLTAQLFSACLVAVYDSIEHAERALHILHHASFPKDQISVVMSRLRKEPELLSEITIGETSVRDAALAQAWEAFSGILAVS